MAPFFEVFMTHFKDKSFFILIFFLTMLSILSLSFVLFFIFKEALPVFQTVSVFDFLFGHRWMPVELTGEPSFGIFYMLLSTIFVSVCGLIFSLLLSVGTAIFLSCFLSSSLRSLMLPVIDLLAGIPSVIYGFIGLQVIVKCFFKIGIHTGSCILAGAILLAIMLIPYLTSGITDSILKAKNRHLPAISNLGINDWYGMGTMILPLALKRCLPLLLIASGRAMGETMAVMMVIGNANLFPRLLGKGETIAALIALEMGTAAQNSPHYHALFAAGLVLLIMMLFLRLVTGMVEKRLNMENDDEMA